MSATAKFLLAVITCALLGTAAEAASRRPADMWSFYHFDGIGFKAGPATDDRAFIAVREYVQPVVMLDQLSNIQPISLPDDSGVIAGICYFSSSGGKLGGPGSGYAPCVRTALLVSLDGKPLVSVQTGDHGFFVSVLPAGKYTIGSGALSDEILVERGVTTLVPLRAGKRMVD